MLDLEAKSGGTIYQRKRKQEGEIPLSAFPNGGNSPIRPIRYGGKNPRVVFYGINSRSQMGGLGKLHPEHISLYDRMPNWVRIKNQNARSV